MQILNFNVFIFIVFNRISRRTLPKLVKKRDPQFFSYLVQCENSYAQIGKIQTGLICILYTYIYHSRLRCFFFRP
jgi:hypothetical protein